MKKIKPFKFLEIKKKVFQFEITNAMRWFPASIMGTETWTSTRSELVKQWVSNHFFYNDESVEKYFPEFDRTCEITRSKICVDFNDNRTFNVTVRICRFNDVYMEIDLIYPVD